MPLYCFKLKLKSTQFLASAVRNNPASVRFCAILQVNKEALLIKERK